MESFDCIVLGTGAVGSAACYHLASRGVKTLGLDRFPAGHDRGSSHGLTRVIRQAYFEHPNYVPLLFRAYELWEQLMRETNQQLFHQTGLFQIGSPDSEAVQGVLKSASEHHLPIEQCSPAEVMKRQPGLFVSESMVGLFEQRAGYLEVENCICAHLAGAEKQGTILRYGESVQSWQPDGEGVTVTTDEGTYRADRLVITAGAWAGDFLHEIGVGLCVKPKQLFWYQTIDPCYREDTGASCFAYDVMDGFFYSTPQTDDGGLKLAEHSAAGEHIADPLHAERAINRQDQQRMEAFIGKYLPKVTCELQRHAVCLYTMSLDQHFIVDRHPEHAQVIFTAGLSGHGFKFSSVLGEIMAQLAIDGKSPLPIDFLSCSRFLSIGVSGNTPL